MTEKQPRHNNRKSCSCLFVILVVAYFVHTGAIPRAVGHWLMKTDKLEKADLIYVFAGGTIERPGYAAKLYKKELAPRVVVGGVLIDFNLVAMGLYFNDGTINRRVVVTNGVPGPAIVQLWYGTSTYEEEEALKHYMIEHKLKSAILVTSAFHTRRVGMCAKRVFRGTNIKLMVAAVPDPYNSLDYWWRTENDLIAIFTEYVKLGYYVVKYKCL